MFCLNAMFTNLALHNLKGGLSVTRSRAIIYWCQSDEMHKSRRLVICERNIWISRKRISATYTFKKFLSKTRVLYSRIEVWGKCFLTLTVFSTLKQSGKQCVWIKMDSNMRRPYLMVFCASMKTVPQPLMHLKMTANYSHQKFWKILYCKKSRDEYRTK